MTQLSQAADALFTLINEPEYGIDESVELRNYRYDLYQADGKTPLPTADIPLFRALNGERSSLLSAYRSAIKLPRLSVGCSFHTATGCSVQCCCLLWRAG